MAINATQLPQNMSALGVLGYLIVVNKQVHSYQIDALNAYLQPFGKSITDTVLDDIINGSEQSVSYASSVKAFEGECLEVQSELIYMLYVLSLVDNSLDTNESGIIDDILSRSLLDEASVIQIRKAAEQEALQIRNSNNVLFERKKIAKKESFIKRLIHWIVSLFKRLFHIEKTEIPIAESYDYRGAIDKCAQIAAEDFSVVKPAYQAVLDACADTINKVQAYKQRLSLETGLSAEVAEAVSIFVDKLNDDVVLQTKDANHSLEQKERTVSDFTISLLGRTKAGKSTLHAILTNQGQERIGVGMQRTTRYNRVYQWNLLRIIDTPGIGSAEADGRTDDEIAASVLGESDVICFVVVDDSILRDVLEFVERIAKLNKPIIILLNHKENIRPEVKFNRFISKPDDWLTTEGEASLQGHINRILRYASDRGFDSLISVYPVFLLPALMSTEPEYIEYSDILWKNSNIDAFIDQLKLWIVNSGSIKRSQTIIDEAAGIFKQSQDHILQAESVLEAQIDSLEQQRPDKIGKLRETGLEVEKRIREFLAEKYNDLATGDALAFAEEEYTKRGDFSEDWKQYVTRIDFENEVLDGINTELDVYRSKAEETVNELFEDFYFSVKSAFSLNQIDVPINFNFRAVARLAGAALGVAGSIVLIVLGASNPVGWVLSIAGLVVGLLSNFLKSKEKKRQQAINKIYNAIHNEIIKSMDSEIENTLAEIDHGIEASVSQVDSLFSDLIFGLKTNAELAEDLRKCYYKQLAWLNKVYGWRILQFVQNKDECYSEDNVNQEIINIDRSTPGLITIVSSEEGEVNPGILRGIIAEEIRIERRH